MPDPESRYLFVTGCARSGTSAMVQLLNADPRLAIGLERFKHLQGGFGRDHFRPDRLLRPRPEETNIQAPELYAAMRAKFERGTVLFVGDKVVSSFKVGLLAGLSSRFPRSRFVFMLRDPERVAASYQRRAENPGDLNWPASKGYEAAILDWNRSLRNLRAMANEAAETSFLIVPYEEFYAGDPDWLRRIYDLLAIEPAAEVNAAYQKVVRDWDQRAERPIELDDAAKARIARMRHGPFEAWALRVIEREHRGRIPRGMGFPRALTRPGSRV